LPFGNLSAQDPLQAVFRTMDQAALTFKSLKADMKKLHHNDFAHEDETDTGTILVKRPKRQDFKVLINFVQPDAKGMSLDGTKVQIYYPKRKEIEEYDLGKSRRGEVEQFILLGFGSNSRELQSAYTIKFVGKETVGDNKTTRLELRPKADDIRSTFPKFE